jgi:hypothetical protein
MSRFSIWICRHDEDQPERLTPVRQIEVPAVSAEQLTPETALEELEAQTLAAGQEVMRQLLLEQWQALDDQCVADYQRLFPPGRDPA